MVWQSLGLRGKRSSLWRTFSAGQSSRRARLGRWSKELILPSPTARHLPVVSHGPWALEFQPTQQKPWGAKYRSCRLLTLLNREWLKLSQDNSQKRKLTGSHILFPQKQGLPILDKIINFWIGFWKLFIFHLILISHGRLWPFPFSISTFFY